MAYTSEYPIIDVTVDAVIVVPTAEGRVGIVLIERGQDPFKGALALPGGFMDLDESAQEAAVREMAEETGLVPDAGKVVRALTPRTDPERDPRMRIISLPFLIWGSPDSAPVAGDDADAVRVLSIQDALQADLAFDHKWIIHEAAEHIPTNLW